MQKIVRKTVNLWGSNNRISRVKHQRPKKLNEKDDV
jgi:hypothetical protein